MKNSTMASQITLAFLLVVSFICTSLLMSCNATFDDGRKAYIVYLGDLPKGEFSASSMHTNMLQEIVGSTAASNHLLHSYKRSFNGFVAKLTHEEAQTLEGMEGVVSVFPNQNKQVHTTRSWDFMGFSQQVRRTAIESDLVIGMLDTGIWPESESFSDENFGPPPQKWKGSCQESSNFTCNNKVIGAKYYRSDGKFGASDFISPRDAGGHGTHTASTAGGNLVSKASFLGIGSGTARGGVPSARIAVYKICWADGCPDADILAAFDDAIADGVDIISISVGGATAFDYFQDSIAIGSFHAMKKGILTSNSGGNSGPDPGTITNVAPWTLSVAASTIDRKFVTKVMLGNGEVYEGVSINTIDFNKKMLPLIYAGDAPNKTGGYTGADSRFCTTGSLDETLVKGKIVFCDELNSANALSFAGAAGSIMQDNSSRDVAFNFPIPNSYLDLKDGIEVLSYISSTRKPTATFFKSNAEDNSALAPSVVSFSSRGPNPITHDILKPDLTAPGVEILAAWTQGRTVTGVEGDTRVVPFNIISGTSMSCPHATASAVYIKSFHPTWSPTAIKSALMTTASPMSVENNIEAEFAYGAGHIDPIKAVDPGLIYDAEEVDYVKFLCGQGYNTNKLRIVTGDNSSCSQSGTVWDLNYPSFALSARFGNSTVRMFLRTVTNVGTARSVYKAIVKAQPGLKIQVKPSVLSFESILQKKSFVVTVSARLTETMVSGSLVWDDGKHQVRSPIVAFVP